MAAGGTFTVQNKTRPGIYFRFRSQNGQSLAIGDRGVVAIPEALSWGPTATVMELDSGADPMPLTGYDFTAPQSRFLNEIFKGSNRTAHPARCCSIACRPAAAQRHPLSSTR